MTPKFNRVLKISKPHDLGGRPLAAAKSGYVRYLVLQCFAPRIAQKHDKLFVKLAQIYGQMHKVARGTQTQRSGSRVREGQTSRTPGQTFLETDFSMSRSDRSQVRSPLREAEKHQRHLSYSSHKDPEARLAVSSWSAATFLRQDSPVLIWCLAACGKTEHWTTRRIIAVDDRTSEVRVGSQGIAALLHSCQRRQSSGAWARMWSRA